jgi:hypothetical protein
MAPSRHKQDGLHSAVLAGDAAAPARVFGFVFEQGAQANGSFAALVAKTPPGAVARELLEDDDGRMQDRE